MSAVRRVLETRDPDLYARWANIYVYYELGRETDGPRRLDRPAYSMNSRVIVRYFPPSADELAEAVMETPR